MSKVLQRTLLLDTKGGRTKIKQPSYPLSLQQSFTQIKGKLALTSRDYEILAAGLRQVTQPGLSINLPATGVRLKFFGGAGVVTPSKPPPPTNNFCLYPPPVLRCFWKDPLMTPHPPPPHFKHLSLLPPTPSTTSPPPKNFDHTPDFGIFFLCSISLISQHTHQTVCTAL